MFEDSPATLRRFLELAENMDISLKRYREIESKLVEVNPPRRITQKDQERYDAMGGTGTPNPRKPARA